jgi:hypothetical protein
MKALNEGRVDPKMVQHFAPGGFVTGAVIPPPPAPPPPPPPPPPRVTPAEPSIAAPTPVAPTTPKPSSPSAPKPGAPPPPPQIAPPPPPQDAAPARVPAVSAPSQIAPAPTNFNHNLAAINTGIASTASTLGSLASMAINAAAAAGSFGASEAAGGLGGGSAGSLISGLFQEGGKIATDVVNVGSSFLVGSVPGADFNTTASASGETLHPQQNVPVTAQQRGGNNYTFNGMDVPKVFQELDLRQAQESQAALAHRPPR